MIAPDILWNLALCVVCGILLSHGNHSMKKQILFDRYGVEYSNE